MIDERSTNVPDETYGAWIVRWPEDNYTISRAGLFGEVKKEAQQLRPGERFIIL